MPRRPHHAPQWGTLESAYTDEFGAVAPDVYAAAGRISHQCQDYATRVLLDGDPARTRTLLLKAAALVTRARDERSRPINELDGYLLQTFRHLILAELEKDNNRYRYETESQLDAEWHAQADNVERRILLNELVEGMDEWTRNIFELLTLDYTFDDIARQLGMNSRVLRTKYNRRLDRLMRQIKVRSGAGGSRTRRE